MTHCPDPKPATLEPELAFRPAAAAMPDPLGIITATDLVAPLAGTPRR
jgi:hypothetical protein